MEKRLNIIKLLEVAESQGLNQSGIAKALNVTRASVSKWLNGKSFPRPAELLKLGRLLKLSYRDIVENLEPSKAPLVAFRKRASCKTTDLHINNAQNMGFFLEPLVEYLGIDEFIGPPSLKNPSCDYNYLQELSARIRRELDVGEASPINFTNIIQLFHKHHAVIIPTLWGHKTKHENALHIHLPESQTTWIYLNLDVEIHDFKFWMAHELGHVLTLDLLREDRSEAAEEFADAFAGALLFPVTLAKNAWLDYIKASSEQNRLAVLGIWAEKHTISPYSVYREIEKHAKTLNATFPIIEGRTLHTFIAAFNKSYKTLSASLFEDAVPTADHFMRVAQENFDTEVYKVLGKYVRKKNPGPSVIATILDVNPMDARAYLDAFAA